MTRAARIAALLTVTAQAPTVSPADAIVSGRFRSSGVRRTYSAFLPPTGHPHPLVILLHGSGGSGHGMAARWRDLARREGIIVAAPDATDRRQWQVPQDGPALFRDLVQELAPHDVDGRRIYLFGYSAGAVFALYMAPLESQYFAAAAVHAGAYDGEADLGFLGRAPRRSRSFSASAPATPASRSPCSSRRSIAWRAPAFRSRLPCGRTHRTPTSRPPRSTSVRGSSCGNIPSTANPCSCPCRLGPLRVDD
jgi:poly(3-hydroxybutyrate) depolymerase